MNYGKKVQIFNRIGLSVVFEEKFNFGLVRINDSVFILKYNVKKFSTPMFDKSNENKQIFYKAHNLTLGIFFGFFYICSEVFVPGGGYPLD
jgi:hypothetical protein